MRLLRHLWKRFGKSEGHRHTEGMHGKKANLSDAAEDSVVIIICNHDHRTVERGLYTGVQVKILRNEREEPNLVVAVGDSRYVLDKRIARGIKVKAV